MRVRTGAVDDYITYPLKYLEDEIASIEDGWKDSDVLHRAISLGVLVKKIHVTVSAINPRNGEEVEAIRSRISMRTLSFEKVKDVGPLLWNKHWDQ